MRASRTQMATAQWPTAHAPACTSSHRIRKLGLSAISALYHNNNDYARYELIHLPPDFTYIFARLITLVNVLHFSSRRTITLPLVISPMTFRLFATKNYRTRFNNSRHVERLTSANHWPS
jgi:hypothetical protein